MHRIAQICQFVNILLARPHQHCGILLVLILNIGPRTLQKIWVYSFLVRNVHPRGKTYDSNGKNKN